MFFELRQYRGLSGKRDELVMLGKALFWDMRVGSDGVQACASCHFHAGADNRSRAQLSPGLLRVGATGTSSADPSFQVGTTTRQLRPEDFPFHKLLEPGNRASIVLSDTNDVVGSQGVYDSRFVMLDPKTSEQTVLAKDKVFTDGAGNLRRVTPRNAPSVINAAYYVRSFWDGRAARIFNGQTPSGLAADAPGALVR